MNHHVGDQENLVQIVEFTPQIRRLIGDAIEALVLLLDEREGDENLEETGDDELTGDEEPTMGATETHHRQTEWGRSAWEGRVDECEQDTDLEPDNDNEQDYRNAPFM